jgi:S1-C subfamily serine protease
MKQLFYLILASFLGGIIALQLDGLRGDERPVNQSPGAQLVSMNLPPTSGADFVYASEVSTPAVVHVYAEESQALAQQRYDKNKQRRRSPFSDFFGEDMFSEFFGQNFYPKQGSGSGVILSEDGYIVTNNHVVGFADNIRVTLTSGKEYRAVKIGTDPATDLAVLKIEADNLPFLKYGNSGKLRIGEWVLAVGNPFSYLKSTVTAGIVSAVGRDLDIIKGEKTIEEFIQTDAAVNPGNSGGALVNVNGELIGINTAIATPTGVYAGYSFAIPSDLVKTVVGDIIEKGGDIDRRVSLGIAGYDVEEDVIEKFNLKKDFGFYVDEVERGGSASLAGILPGDIVTGMDGDKVQSFDTIKDKMNRHKVGDKISIEVDRDGKKKNFTIILRKGL